MRIIILILIGLFITGKSYAGKDYRIEIPGPSPRLYQSDGEVTQHDNGNLQFKDKATGKYTIISPPYVITECKNCPLPAPPAPVQAPAQ